MRLAGLFLSIGLVSQRVKSVFKTYTFSSTRRGPSVNFFGNAMTFSYNFQVIAGQK